MAFDKFKEECGVFAVSNNNDASALTALGLHALQHRGQEACGIVSFDGETFHKHLAYGKVGDNFSSKEVIDKLQGSFAIGHNRYSTSGDKNGVNNIQPIFAETSKGKIAIAHNGNLVNANDLRQKLVNEGSIFSTSMDSEVIIHLIATSHKKDFYSSLIEALDQIKGGFSLVAISENEIVGLRDPLGIRPLVLGKLKDSFVLTSETVALDIIGAKYVREVKPGEIIRITSDGKLESKIYNDSKKEKFCIFEYVYFARPDSFFAEKSVYNLRKEMGRQLAKLCEAEVDIVVPVPDSGVPAAIGYSEQKGVPFELGIIRNHYIGRTFIEPSDNIRNLGVRLKHNANSKILEGKKVALIDDSIVRGTTSKKIVDMIKRAGAKEIHMRISSPPTIGSCFYGIDTPSKKDLIANKLDLEGIRKFIGVDSLQYLSLDSLYRAIGEGKRNYETSNYCDACFSGEYPIAV
jgi:amidophosphoribosyltransferase